MIAFFALFQFAVLGGMGVAGPLVARSKLGGAAVWGAMLSAAAIGALAGGALALASRPRRMLVAACLSLFGVVLVLVTLSLAAPRPWQIGAMLMYGGAISYTDALWYSAMQANVPPEKISRVSSFDWLGSTALYPLGLALAGPVAAAIGVSNELRSMAALLVAGVLTLLAVPSVWRVTLGEPITAKAADVPTGEAA